MHIVADLKGIDSACSLVVVKSHRIAPFSPSFLYMYIRLNLFSWNMYSWT